MRTFAIGKATGPLKYNKHGKINQKRTLRFP